MRLSSNDDRFHSKMKIAVLGKWLMAESVPEIISMNEFLFPLIHGTTVVVCFYSTEYLPLLVVPGSRTQTL